MGLRIGAFYFTFYAAGLLAEYGKTVLLLTA